MARIIARKGEDYCGYTLACDLYEPTETTEQRYKEWQSNGKGKTFEEYLEEQGFEMCEDVFTAMDCEAEQQKYYVPSSCEEIHTFEF